MNDLLRSFEIQSNVSPSKSEDEDTNGGVFWHPVLGIDQELEKLFRDVRGHTSDIHHHNWWGQQRTS